jgi:anaerobic selenocysteine-containing dehydrogenase
MVVTTEGGRVTRIEGDRDDVFSRGHICPKGPAMAEVQHDPDRLRHPVRRTKAGTFERVSWDAALSEVTARLSEAQRAHGRHAVGVYFGNPIVHGHGLAIMSQLFARAIHTRNKFDANSQDANPKLYASHFMYGALTAMTVPDIDRTDFLFMLGANPVASNGSIMSLGDVRGRLGGLRERGAKLVVVDPRRTETARIADEHVFIRPGGDAALLLAMIAVLFEEKRVDEVAVSRVARGVGALRDAARPFTPERVGPAIGVEAATIRRLALEFSNARSAVAYSRVGVCQGAFGPVASWLVEALNVVTGNFDRPGGAMFPSPAIDLAGLAAKLGVSGAGRFRSRVRGLPEVGGMLPAATMADEIETPGKGQIRAMVTLAGNPVLSVPNGERLARAFDSLDFMVSIDMYVNETTRHANLVLPPHYALERGHYDVVFHALAVHNTSKWSERVLPPEGDTRDEWELLRELAVRLVARREGGARLEAVAKRLDPLALLGSERAIDLLLRLGRYGDHFVPGRDGLSLAKLRRAPHGVDLGPLVAMRKERVRTPDGLVDLAPAPLLADVPRVARFVDEPPAGDVVLIGRRHLRSNNSWMHNVRSLVKGPDRAALLVHPDDARRLGLEHGKRARLRSRIGEVEVSVEVTADIAPGVVSLPHGYGHEAAKDTLRTAGAVPGVNMNAITDDALVEPLTGTAILNGTPVQIAPSLPLVDHSAESLG